MTTQELDQARLVVNKSLARVVCARCMTCLHPDDVGNHLATTHREKLVKGAHGQAPHAATEAWKAAIARVYEEAGIPYPPPKPSTRPQDLVQSSEPRPPAALPVPEYLLQNAEEPPLAVQPFPLYQGFQCTTCRKCYRTEKSFYEHCHKARREQGDTHPERHQDCMEPALLQRFSKEPQLSTFIRVGRTNIGPSLYTCDKIHRVACHVHSRLPQVSMPSDRPIPLSDDPQPLLDLAQRCKDLCHQDLPPEGNVESDPHLQTLFIHSLPWVAEPPVVELHDYLVTLTAGPGKSFKPHAPSTVLREKFLEAAVVTHVRKLRRLMEDKFYLRQVRHLLTARALKNTPT